MRPLRQLVDASTLLVWVSLMLPSSAIGRDLEGPALEAFRPEVEPFNGLEAKVLSVPARCRFPVGHANVDMIEP